MIEEEYMYGSGMPCFFFDTLSVLHVEGITSFYGPRLFKMSLEVVSF